MPYTIKNIELTIAHITREEGCKLELYKDHLGFNTIGVGHLLDQEQTEEELEIIGSPNVDKITQEQAKALLEVDINEAMEDMSLIFTEEEWDAIDGTRQCVLVSQIFQVGGAGLRKFRKMIAAVKSGDWDKAATESLDSLAARQTPGRWERQADMLRNGDVNEVEIQDSANSRLSEFSDAELLTELYIRLVKGV